MNSQSVLLPFAANCGAVVPSLLAFEDSSLQNLLVRLPIHLVRSLGKPDTACLSCIISLCLHGYEAGNGLIGLSSG